MGVTLRYCDLCGKKLEAAELEAPETLKVKEKIFCGGCRPKVVAAIQKQKAAKAAAAGDAAADAPSAAAPKSNAPRRAPAPKSGRKGAAGASPARKAAEQPGKPAAAKPAAARARAKAAGAPSQAGPARAKPAAGRGKPGAPARGRPGAAGRGKATAGRGGAVAGRGRAGAAAEPVDLGPEGDEGHEFHVKKRSSTPIILVVIAVVAIGVVGLMAALPGGGGKPPEETQEIVKKVDREAEELARQEKLAKESFDSALETLGKYPEHYETNIQNFNTVARSYAKTEAGQQALQKQLQLQDEWREKARGKLEDLKSRIDVLAQEKKFDEALELVQELPPVLIGSDLTLEFRNLRIDARAQARAMARFEELEVKALRRLEKGEEDIALYVLDELPQRFEEDAPAVWEIKERTVREIKREGTKGWISRMKERSAELAEAEKVRKAEEALARAERWNALLNDLPWKSQLNPRSLYNWVVDSDGVRGRERPEWKFSAGVLKANNSNGHMMYKGIFTNFWQDYALRFEVKVVKGSLKIYPRATYRVDSTSFAATTRPVVELKSDDFSGRFTRVTLFVRGDDVELRKGAADTEFFKKTYDGDEDNMPAEGGFVFVIDDGSHVEIKAVETKLVNHGRKRLY